VDFSAAPLRSSTRLAHKAGVAAASYPLAMRRSAEASILEKTPTNRQLAQLETRLHTPAKMTPQAPASRTPYLYKIQLMQPKLVARRARIYPSFRSAIIGLFKPNARIG
jgi:hypothetical protein